MLVRGSCVIASIACLLGSASASLSQSGTFVPGSRDIFVLDFQNLGPGGLPKGVTAKSVYSDRYLDAAPDLVSVVTKDGVPMLKAVKHIELRIQLPEALPDAFTLEFEIIPKACCGPEDLSFDGTVSSSRSPTSMQVVWLTESISAVGGCEQCLKQIANPLKDVVAAQPTKIAASLQGKTFQLFTNGQAMFDPPLDNRNFVHGRLLRVSLGGQGEGDYAVYLSKLRIAAGGGAVATATSADLAAAASGGATGTLTAATGTQTIGTVRSPTTTTANTPTSPGVTAGPLPAGSLTSPSATIATQPTASSPTNPLPVVSTTTTTATQQQASTARPDTGIFSGSRTAPATTSTATPSPTPAAKTVTGTTSPTAPGPATLTATDLRATNGFGVQLKWPALPGISSYVVSRKLGLTTDPARYVSVILVPSTDASTVTAIDPYVDLNTRYTYWVSGFASTGGETQPSPIANVTVAMNPPGAPSTAKVVSVTAPQMRSMPGVLAASSPMLGSAVTWEWTKVVNVDVYHVSYEIVGGVAGVGPVFVRNLVTTFGAATPPPMTVNVPQGKTVRLCVHLYASADLTAQLPAEATCTQTTVP